VSRLLCWLGWHGKMKAVPAHIELRFDAEYGTTSRLTIPADVVCDRCGRSMCLHCRRAR